MHKDVIWLYISMHYIASRENFEGFNNLSEISKSSFLREGSFFLHEFVKCSSVAVFVDKIKVIGSFEHIDVFYYVGAGLQG